MDEGKNIKIKPNEEEMIDIRRQHGKHLCNILFPPEIPELERIETSCEEAITLNPYLKGRLAEENQKVTLNAYLQEYRIRIEVILAPSFFSTICIGVCWGPSKNHVPKMNHRTYARPMSVILI